MKKALLVIDVQNDYFKNGAMELVDSDLALKKINILETYFKHRNLPIIYIQHLSPVDAAFFREGSDGAKLHSGLKVDDDSIIITKKYPNSFFQTDLNEQLKSLNVEQLVVTGMMTHICVDSTTRAAKELGFNPILISDATATRDLEINNRKVSAQNVQTAFIAALNGFFAEVLNTSDFLDNINL